MDREQFANKIRLLINDPHNENVRTWIEWAEQCVEQDQHAYFKEYPKDEAVSVWLDAYHASLYFVRKGYGANIAKQIIDLSAQHLCLYPYEMHEAAKQLQSGASIELLQRKMQDGSLVTDGPWPTLEDVKKDRSRIGLER